MELKYQIYGDPKGKSTLFFHGWPGSSLEAALIAQSAHKYQLKLIAIDRFEEYGSKESDFYRFWAQQIKAFLDELEIQRVDVIAVSGGAPFVYALLNYYEGLVDRVSIVSGITPLNTSSHLTPILKFASFSCRYFPLLIDLVIAYLTIKFKYTPKFAMRTLLWLSSKRDKKTLTQKSIEEFVIANTLKATQNGHRSLKQELCALCGDWGFEPHNIQKPIHLWHGSQDRVISIKMVEEFAQKSRVFKLYPNQDEGHYSLPIERIDEILHEHTHI